MKPTTNSSAKLGTFLGVFTPSILTILGVIMYLRIGWVVGNAGLFPTLSIVVLSNLITLTTALSMSAVSTNMRVGAGGAYYLISRSLGLEIGGAIGIPLYLSQALSVTLYAFGLAESLVIVWPEAPIRLVAGATIVLVTLVSARSASLALKLQLPIMVAVALSIISLMAGASFEGRVPVFWGDYAGASGYWGVFAVFFPAVTGTMAGVSMSGDLSSPQRSIPLGTVSAVLVGFVVYLAVPVVLAFNMSTDVLLSDSLVWTRIAPVAALILPGLWGAVLSSAVGSILGAPRTLQALAGDGVVPGVLGRYRLKSGESVVAIGVTAGLGLAAVLLGDLNAVAPLVTVFFLTTYGMVNFVAGMERLIADPSYRPRLRVPWVVSLAGAVACFWVMFVINALACVVAVVTELGVWVLLHRRRMQTTWGDMRRGIWIAMARYALVNLRATPMNPRNWRPNILVFAGDVARRLELVRLASWLNQNRGILTVCNLVVESGGHGEQSILAEEESIDHALDEEGLVAFGEVNVVRDFEDGVFNIAQANGIGGLSSNTLMFGWSDNLDHLATYFRIMGRVSELKQSVLIARIAPRATFERSKHIDIWWRGQQHNGDLMLLLAHLLSLNREWEGGAITVKSIASSDHMKQAIEADLDELIPRVRIDADVHVVLKPEDQTVKEIMLEESQEAEVVFMGMMQPEPGEERDYAQRLTELVEGFPSVVLVRNSGWFAGELV